MNEKVKKPIDDGSRESPAGNSIMSLFQACPRKWFFKYVLGWKAKGISDALILGSVFHKAQEEFYDGGFDYKKTLDKGLELIQEADPLLTNKLASLLHIWYSELGKFERDRVEVLMVEKPIDIKLPNGFVMTGRLDRLLKDKEVDQVFISDSKTTGWDLTKTLRNYTYHPQPKLYYAGFQDTFPQLAKECVGWRTDGVYCRERMSKGQGTGEYYGNAERSPLVSFLDGQIEDIRNSYASYTDDMAYRLASLEKEGSLPSIAFPACSSNCLAYNKVCEYYNECHKVDKSPSMPGNFIYDTWVDDGTVLNQFRELDAYKEV